MKSAADYFTDNKSLFEMSFICKFVDYSGHADSAAAIDLHGKLTNLKIDLDYCLTVEAEAYNVFDNFKLIIRFCYGEDEQAYSDMKKNCSELLQKGLAVLVTGHVYSMVQNEIALYDPEIEIPGFRFE